MGIWPGLRFRRVLGGTAEVVWKASGDVVQLHEVALLDHTIKLGQLSGSPIAHGGARGAWTGPMCARSAEPCWKTLINKKDVGTRVDPLKSLPGLGSTTAQQLAISDAFARMLQVISIAMPSAFPQANVFLSSRS